MLNEKVGTSSLELCVIDFLHYNDDIAWLLSGVMVSFAMEGVFSAIRRTLINLNINYLLFLLGLFTIALFTFVLFVYFLTLTVTFIARAL